MQFEAVLFGESLQDWDWLLAVGRIVIDVGDLLALQLVQAAGQFGEVFDLDVAGIPIGAEDWEGPADDVAVGALAAPIAAGQQRNLVDGSLVHQGVGDPGRQWHKEARPGRALAFEALVTLDATVGSVAGLAFLEGYLDPVDAAVARVQQVQVIGKPVGERYAVRSVGTGAIDQGGKELLILSYGRRRDEDANRREERPF